ncbi:bifunctional 4-hydroxy-2-oxoglutarate aldolase/2-dehydro-3-deoxy-phosphogluconate aldolase [Sphingobacterium sp. lm-10]|uniref:bifunctional 4-hydroxy-2-oxoglutarate aldolase/2-dehydro-3-deoxy-phosphogluconate aldolase n=1 Tax=Sphingobacterium sp. lm-10 TaxID=2944904 RepID=UPI002020FB5F|nr:bifunctional 4-hydroxy-2-oxoglutarate aldolase/2-dehydro-3-deoxy-phosphogluconate aldolase [Sphingobacterium sp. lm-10]MCL7988874.1 bifunctional 4-hydroxy-2-oxoglutarate aldolase/2-dehydro-3-deoxy-phosphogluconate aldolase [Sphingobacterium sp. lm-10]
MSKLLSLIQQYPAIPVYYHDDPQTCIEVLQACYKGGIRIFEFVNRGPEAKTNFKALLAYKNEHFPYMALGIGTIKTAHEAKDFLALGAEFIVSPIVSADIAQETLAKGYDWIPGCMTPTEITLAESLGASLIKLFPGDALGPKFVKAIKPLFPNLHFMPTGGVDVEKENIDGWFNAGVFSVGLGSKLFQKPNNSDDGYQWLIDRVSTLMELVER